MNYNDFFDKLAADDGRNYKIDLLNKHAHDKVLKKIVKAALDPFTQYYIRKIPEYQPNPNDGIALSFGVDTLNDLANRLVTGNAGISHLKSTLEALNESDAKVIERIIAKDLKCGVSISTANKVWPNLILDYPVMLCSQYEQKLVDKINYPAYVQTKMDGMRFNAIVKNGAVEYRSRNGKEIQLLGNLDNDFIRMANGVDCVFDGELLVVDNAGIMDRQTGNGILNKANKGTISDQEAGMVRATIWDLIPYNDFVNGKCSVHYEQRYDSLCIMVNTYQPTKVSLVDSWQVENYTEAQTLFEGLLAQGQEGIILKDFRGVWENKRTKSQIKFKGELECDLKIVGIQPGTGKYEGMLGAILCESADGVVKVSVGSGFNDEHRQTLGDEIIGKIVAVKYNARITNKQGEESLFLPIFVEVREDKDVADRSKDIK